MILLLSLLFIGIGLEIVFALFSAAVGIIATPYIIAYIAGVILDKSMKYVYICITIFWLLLFVIY